MHFDVVPTSQIPISSVEDLDAMVSGRDYILTADLNMASAMGERHMFPVHRNMTLSLLGMA